MYDTSNLQMVTSNLNAQRLQDSTLELKLANMFEISSHLQSVKWEDEKLVAASSINSGAVDHHR